MGFSAINEFWSHAHDKIQCSSNINLTLQKQTNTYKLYMKLIQKRNIWHEYCVKFARVS